MPAALKLACIFLASGHSTRFGGNKLLADFGGRPLADVIFSSFPAELFHQTAVVTRYAQVAVCAAEHGFSVVENSDETGDIAISIRRGLEALPPRIDGCMFSVCDQPLLTARSVLALADEFRAHPACIVALGWQGRRGNPVFFPAALFGELAALPAHHAGGAVIAAHPALLRIAEAQDARELADVDCRADLELLNRS